MLFKLQDKSSPPSYKHYAMLYPQNGDRIVAIDSVTSLHPICMSRTQGIENICTTLFREVYSVTMGRPTRH